MSVKTLSVAEVKKALSNLGIEIPAGMFSTPASTKKTGGKIFNAKGLEIRQTSNGRWIEVQPDGSSRFTSNPKKGTGTTNKAKPPKKEKAATTSGKAKTPAQVRNWAMAGALRSAGYGNLCYNREAWTAIKNTVITAVGKPWDSIPVEKDGQLCDVALEAMAKCAKKLSK